MKQSISTHLNLKKAVAQSLALTLGLAQIALGAESGSSTQQPTVRKPGAPAAKAGQTQATATDSAAKVQRSSNASAATPTSATSTASAAGSWRQNISASLVSNIAGPSVGDPSEYQPDSSNGQADSHSPVRTENTLGVGLKLANGASVGAAMNFVYTPVADTGLEMQDPYLAIKKPLVDKNGFSLLAQLRAYVATSTPAQAANQIGRTRLVLVQNYTPTNSRCSVGVTGYAQSYFYNGNRAANATKTKLLAEPSINYQIKPNLTAGLMYDMLAKNKFNNSFFNFYEAEETALSPNVSWDVNEKLNLSPYLSIPTGKRIAADTTTINLLLSMRLL